MKKHFMTGLIILLPAALTVVLVIFFLNMLTGPFMGLLKGFWAHYDLLQSDTFLLSAEQMQWIISQVIILLFLVAITTALGVIARLVFFHYILRLWEYTFHRIPFIRAIYKMFQDVINALFDTKAKSFKQAVLVPFPHQDVKSIGFITNDEVVSSNGDEYLSIYIPTTPIPTTGFLVLFKKSDVILIDNKVEETMKFIISCGVISIKLVKSEKQHLQDSEQNNKI